MVLAKVDKKNQGHDQDAPPTMKTRVTCAWDAMSPGQEFRHQICLIWCSFTNLPTAGEFTNLNGWCKLCHLMSIWFDCLMPIRAHETCPVGKQEKKGPKREVPHAKNTTSQAVFPGAGGLQLGGAWSCTKLTARTLLRASSAKHQSEEVVLHVFCPEKKQGSKMAFSQKRCCFVV